jgi:hypothetical protein
MAAFAPGAPMRREHAFYSGWCRLFDFHLKRLRWSAAAFAVKANRSQQAIHAYLVGRARPPLDQVPLWAAMLGLHGEERARFILAAQEAHVPEPVWKRLQDLETAARAVRLATTPDQRANELALAQAVIAELVQLLRELEGLFFTRTVPVDRIPTVRATLMVATRRAIERYAKAPGLES